jgi:exodeoxyribonuclease VII small subunit
MAETAVGKLSFEDAIAELEQVVNRLDSGDVPLDESIRLYERGAALKAHCERKLDAADAKVRQITLDAQGRATGTTAPE